MDMTVAIQYILTDAQSLGSQVYYKKLSNDDIWACWCIILPGGEHSHIGSY